MSVDTKKNTKDIRLLALRVHLLHRNSGKQMVNPRRHTNNCIYKTTQICQCLIQVASDSILQMHFSIIDHLRCCKEGYAIIACLLWNKTEWEKESDTVHFTINYTSSIYLNVEYWYFMNSWTCLMVSDNKRMKPK